MGLTKYMLSLLLKILSRNREFYNKLSEQADKIIVWLVGFSITSIALSISNESLLRSIDITLPKTIVIFASLSIILGISYRLFMYIAQSLENHLLINFEGYVEGYINPPEIPISRTINTTETIEDLRMFLKNDFNIDIIEIDTENLSINQYNKVQEDLYKYYKTLETIHNQRLESEKAEIKNILKKSFGYSDKKLEQIFNPTPSKIRLTSIYWISIHTASALFLLSTMAFTAGIIMFLSIYLCEK